MADIPEVEEATDSGPSIGNMFRLIAAAAIVVVAVIFISQNSETVELVFLTWDFEMPRIVLLIGTTIVSILVWELGGFVLRRRRRGAS